MPHLINTKSMSLESPARFPEKYAILSHTWGSEEMAFDDMATNTNTQFFLRARKRCTKLQFSAQMAKKLGYDYIWMDTCCIDKSSTAGLSEAINSMHKYYQNSDLCICYLEDVRTREDLPNARWFKRGWTLQELIFSPHIQFFGAEGAYIGSKKSLLQDLSSITGIDAKVLTGEIPLHNISIAHRMSWMANRNTTRPEDMAYCMLPLFGLTMQLCYGEGETAFRRLQALLLSQNRDLSLLAWTGPASRWGAIADSPRAFANTCSCTTNDTLEFTTRAQLKADLSGTGLSATLLCWMADPTDWTRWYAVVENRCSTHPDQAPHVIELRQLHPRRLQFVRVHSESHIVYGNSTDTLQNQIIFEEESFRNRRLLREHPSHHAGVCSVASYPAPVYPAVENDPWQMDLLSDDNGNKFYRADVCPRYRDIVIRFTDPSPRAEESNSLLDIGDYQQMEVKFESEIFASFNKMRLSNDDYDDEPTLVIPEDEPLEEHEKITGLKSEIVDIFKTIIDENGYIVDDDWFLVVDTGGTESRDFGTQKGFLQTIKNKIWRRPNAPFYSAISPRWL